MAYVIPLVTLLVEIAEDNLGADVHLGLFCWSNDSMKNIRYLYFIMASVTVTAIVFVYIVCSCS